MSVVTFHFGNPANTFVLSSKLVLVEPSSFSRLFSFVLNFLMISECFPACRERLSPSSRRSVITSSFSAKSLETSFKQRRSFLRLCKNHRNWITVGIYFGIPIFGKRLVCKWFRFQTPFDYWTFSILNTGQRGGFYGLFGHFWSGFCAVAQQLDHCVRYLNGPIDHMTSAWL